MNNSDKAALLYNSKGKGEQISAKIIGTENMSSTNSEKLLGLHLNSDFEWSTHIEKISIELKKRIGLLKRIKNRVPKNKLVMTAEAIFNSKIRYGIALYLNPVYEEEDLKMERLSKNAAVLQTLQNKMIRVIFSINKKKHINMQHLREKMKMMSVNQMNAYHTLLEAYNIICNCSSEQIQKKWANKNVSKHFFRSESKNDQRVPEKPAKKCIGFSYHGAKLFNLLPGDIKEAKNSKTFKTLIKEWIWKTVPSY